MSKLIIKDLDTYRRIYEPDGKTPEMLAEANGQELVKGQEVTVSDGGGNSVRCVVRRALVAVVPDWETYNQGVAKGQGSML